MGSVHDVSLSKLSLCETGHALRVGERRPTTTIGAGPLSLDT